MSDLSREQEIWDTKFRRLWGQFLSHLGATFYGESRDSFMKGAGVAKQVIEKVYQAALKECRGTLGLNRLVMLFGWIGGSQFGIDRVQEKDYTFDSDFPVEAGKMFESAFRVAYQKILKDNPKDKPEITGPDGRPLQ